MSRSSHWKTLSQLATGTRVWRVRVAEAPTVLTATAEAVRHNPALLEHEVFGPAAVVFTYTPGTDLPDLAALFGGQLTDTYPTVSDLMEQPDPARSATQGAATAPSRRPLDRRGDPGKS